MGKRLLTRFFRDQGSSWCRGVEIVVSDGSQPYRAAISQYLPHARHVLDRFHVVRWFTEGLTLVRRELQRRPPDQTPPTYEPDLFRARFTLLRRADHLSEAHQAHLDRLFSAHPRLKVAWDAPQELYGIYEAGDLEAANQALERFVDLYDSGQIPEYRDVVDKIIAWGQEILAYHPGRRASNGPLKGINNLLQVLRRVAHRFTNYQKLRRPRAPRNMTATPAPERPKPTKSRSHNVFLYPSRPCLHLWYSSDVKASPSSGRRIADMFLSKMADKLLAALREQSPSDILGSVAAAIGIILVVSGIVLQDNYGVGFGATIRSMGGVLLLGGLGTVLFVESRRRAAAIGAARRIVERYKAVTVTWHWPNRMGLAGVAIGLVLLAPALVLQILFGSSFGAIVMAPGIVLFWFGVALLIYGWFHRRNAAQKPKQSSAVSPSRRGGRGNRDRGVGVVRRIFGVSPSRRGGRGNR